MTKNGTYDPATGEVYYRGNWYATEEELEEAKNEYEYYQELKWEEKEEERRFKEEECG